MPSSWPGDLVKALESLNSWKLCKTSNAVESSQDYPQMECFFANRAGTSDHYQIIKDFVEKVRFDFSLQGACVRAKANLNFNTSPCLISSAGTRHIDYTRGTSVLYYPQDHESGTFFYNEVKEPTRVDCIKNRLVVFPANQLHAMELPKSVTPRFVLSCVFDLYSSPPQ